MNFFFTFLKAVIKKSLKKLHQSKTVYLMRPVVKFPK